VLLGARISPLAQQIDRDPAALAAAMDAPAQAGLLGLRAPLAAGEADLSLAG